MGIFTRKTVDDDLLLGFGGWLYLFVGQLILTLLRLAFFPIVFIQSDESLPVYQIRALTTVPGISPEISLAILELTDIGELLVGIELVFTALTFFGSLTIVYMLVKQIPKAKLVTIIFLIAQVFVPITLSSFFLKAVNEFSWRVVRAPVTSAMESSSALDSLYGPRIVVQGRFNESAFRDWAVPMDGLAFLDTLSSILSSIPLLFWIIYFLRSRRVRITYG